MKSIVIGTVLLLLGSMSHAGMNIAVLAGVKQLPNEFHDEIEHQTAFGVQFEHGVRRLSYVVTFLYSADKHKQGEQYTFVEKVVVSTTEIRLGARYRFNSFYVGGGPSVINTTQQYKLNSEGIGSLQRTSTKSSSVGYGAYFEVGKDWQFTKNIRVGVQYGRSVVSRREDGVINGVGKSIVLGTIGYRF